MNKTPQMRYVIIFLSVLMSGNTFAQLERNNILSSSTIVTIDAIAHDGKLAITSQYVNESDFITITTPVLKDADIHIVFDIELPKDAAHCWLGVELSNKTGEIIVKTAREIYQSTKESIILFDITEQGLYLNEQYKLTIYHNLIGNTPCEATYPEFDWNEKKWPLLTTSLGLIGLGISEIGLKAKQKSEYSDYIDLWKSGALNDTENLLQNAIDTKDTRRIVTWGSGLLATGGVLWLIINKRKMNKRQEQYNRYCKSLSNLSITPNFGYQSNNTALGLKLSYQF